MTRYARSGPSSPLAPLAVAGGSLLLLGALLALLGRLTLLALRGLIYAALILTTAIVLGAGALAARWPRRRHLYELLDPVGNCAVDRYDAELLDPAELDRVMHAPGPLIGVPVTQDPPTLVDDLLTPPTRKDPTMPLTLTDELDVDRPISTARRLAALTRLMDAIPSLDVDDAAALIDAAAYHVTAGHHDAAQRVLGLTAPGTALELVEILAR